MQPQNNNQPFTGNNNPEPITYGPSSVEGIAVQPQQSSEFFSDNQATSQPNSVQPTNLPSQNQPVFGSGGFQVPPIQPIQPKKSIFKRKIFWFSLGGALLLILAGAGFVFGYYLPNQPNNVWNTGLNRSGKAIDKIIGDTTKKDNLDTIKKSEVTIGVDLSGDGMSFKGDAKLKFDPSKGTFNVNVVSSADGQEQKLSLDVLSEVGEGHKLPDTFVKFSGFSAFGLDLFAPGINEYDGKWISITESDLQSYGLENIGVDQNDITANDIAELSQAVTETTVDYVFTSDPSKAVIVQKEFVGKEKTDGMNTYHYKASIDKNHAKDYCKALMENLFSKESTKKILGVEGDKINEEKDSAIKSCQEEASNIDDNLVFDVWVDGKYKLIHKIRFTEKDGRAYTEIGQNYTGGDNLTMFVLYKDTEAKSETKFELATNFKTNVSKGTFTYKEEGDNAFNGNASLEAKPYTGEIDVTKPAGAIPIKDVLSKFGISPSGTQSQTSGVSGGIQQKARDSERQTDINALHSQLEAYYAQNGFYPPLKQLNDITWVKANFTGMSQEALKDPSGTTFVLGETSTTTKYGYRASGCNTAQTECTIYVLSATLEGGGIYTKQNLN